MRRKVAVIGLCAFGFRVIADKNIIEWKKMQFLQYIDK